MGQFTITLSDELEHEVRTAVRRGEFDSVSDFVRDAIKANLSNRPSYWERFIAAMTLENNKLLKEQLDKKHTWSGDELLVSLQDGYLSRYNEAENIVSRNELSVESARFVEDVLSMYGELQRAYDLHSKDEKLGEQVLFEGFDGNAGDGLLGYTSFLADHGLFTFIRPLDKVPHLNSHSQVNSIYERMLDQYKSIKAARGHYNVLTLEEVDSILQARIHPENR